MRAHATGSLAPLRLLAAVALATAGLLLVPSLACAAPSDAITMQSASTASWPKVTMRVVMPANMLTGGTLRSSDFTLKENGAAVSDLEVKALGSARQPLDVVLLMDVSGSMKGRALADAKSAANAFIAALAASDRVTVMSFGSKPSVEASSATDRTLLTGAIAGLQAGDQTALYDALVAASERFPAKADADRAIVLLSDGGDTASGNSLSSASESLSNSGVPVYAVALKTSDLDVGALTTLARASGGRLFQVGDTSGLSSVFGGIATQLTQPYELAYTSLRPAAKDLEIDLVASARDGRATLSAAVPNPDALAALGTAVETAPVPSAVWPIVIAALVFIAVAAFVASVIVLTRPAPNALGQLKFYEQLREGGVAGQGSEGAQDPDSARGRLTQLAQTVATRSGFESVLRLELERAGLPLRPAEYMGMHVSLVLVIGLAAQFLSGNALITGIAVVLVALGPIVLLARLARRRTEAFQAQLPDVLNLLAGSLRSGWGLLQAAGIVVKEMPAPAGPEFERVVTEARLGLPLEDALTRMAERMASEDFKWAVTAIAIQREVGGNLAEVLDLVAETVRERSGLRRQISSLTSEGRLSAIILIALPFIEAIGLWVLNPTYFTRLLSSPTGVGAITVASLLLIIGIVWLNRVVNIEV